MLTFHEKKEEPGYLFFSPYDSDMQKVIKKKSRNHF